MRSRALNFRGVVPAGSTITERFAIRDRTWCITELRIAFLPGQAGTLFVGPQAEELAGARQDLLQPAPEVTGDDWAFVMHNVPFRFVPGTAIVFSCRNASLRHSRAYSIQVILAGEDEL